MITADDSAANAVERFNDGVDDTYVDIDNASKDVDDVGVNVRFDNEVDAQAYNATSGVTTGGKSGNFTKFALRAKRTLRESASSVNLPV
jgi:hypothetical protein